jgi:hypothetical protein
MGFTINLSGGGGATTSSLTFSAIWYFPTNNSWNSWSGTQAIGGQ